MYEREVDDVVQKVHRWFAEQVFEKYNEHLKEAGIFIKLEGLQPLFSYEITYDELSFRSLAGTDKVQERVDILKKSKESIIYIASTPLPVEPIRINENNPCKTSYFTSFNVRVDLPGDTMTIFIKTLRDWMSSVFGLKIPDIFDLEGEGEMDKVIDILKEENFKYKLEICRNTNSTGESASPAKLDEIRNLLEELITKIDKEPQKPTPKTKPKKNRSLSLPKSLLLKTPKKKGKKKLSSEDTEDKENVPPKKETKDFASLRRAVDLLKKKTEKNKSENKVNEN